MSRIRTDVNEFPTRLERLEWVQYGMAGVQLTSLILGIIRHPKPTLDKMGLWLLGQALLFQLHDLNLAWLSDEHRDWHAPPCLCGARDHNCIVFKVRRRLAARQLLLIVLLMTFPLFLGSRSRSNHISALSTLLGMLAGIYETRDLLILRPTWH